MTTDRTPTLSESFRHLAVKAAAVFGTHWAFATALAIIVGWAVTGPLFHWSEAWQLVINTGTTIITFLMVFLIQATQNRDAKALQLKLDELIRSSTARNIFADLEDASDEELQAFHLEFVELRKQGLVGIEAAAQAHEVVRARHRKRHAHHR